MSRLDLLRKNYQRICGIDWDRNVAGPQQVWLAVHDKEDERKLRLRLGLFKETTEQCGKHWFAIDLTDFFAEWLSGSAYADFAESYFESPSRLDAAQMSEQAIGWHPDLNDGVRMNIRPFVEAGILRKPPNIKWTKDRGKGPERDRDEYR